MGLFKDCGCGCNGRKQQDKLTTSVISGLTFFIIANPETFRLVRRILGPRIATPTGCPSTTGLLVHSIVFILIVWGMMNVNKEVQTTKNIGPSAICTTCSDDTTTTTNIIPPKRMVDITPGPGMEEIQFIDTGLALGGLDISGTYL